MTVISMDRIRKESQAGDRHWFDPAAMRFFRSRVGSAGYGTDDGELAFFVSSEQFDAESPRLYTVRIIHLPTGQIEDTREGFQAFTSRDMADRRARRYAGKPDEACAITDPAGEEIIAHRYAIGGNGLARAGQRRACLVHVA